MARPNQLNKKNNFGYLTIEEAENTYWIKRIQMPSVSISAQQIGSKALNMQFEGKLNYGRVTLTFLVDEGLENYIELYDWMIKVGATYEEITPNIYSTFKKASCDIRFTILSNSHKILRRVCFVDAFPIDLANIEFSSENGSDIQTCDVTFAFTHFKFTEA